MANLEAAPNAAVDEWIRILGKEHVNRDPRALGEAETATYPTSQKIPVILAPADAAQVSHCLKTANRHGIPVYPLSGGKNWGYGCRVPYADGCALIDLSRMNRIRDYNEKLAYVVVEPGVTQKQLFDFLQARGGRLWIDPTSSSPHASVIGNILERGHGLTPYSDHVAFSCDYEAVLPSGQIIRSSGAVGRSAAVPKVDAWSAGPSIQGLLTQSSLAIVTEMTVWLMPAPECTRMACFTVDSDEELPEALEAIRPLRLDGTLRSGPFIVNYYRCLQVTTPYPWELAGGKTPLAPGLAKELAAGGGISHWNGFFAMYGSREQIEAHTKRVGAALRPRVRRLSFFEDGDFSDAAPASPMERYISFTYRRMTARLEDSLIRQPYWRVRKEPSPQRQPESDGCGVVFCPTSIPFTGEDAARIVGHATARMLEGGFEPSMSLVGIRERALHCYLSIMYDRQVPGEDGRAMACQEKLIGSLWEMGYPPVRLGIHSMKQWEQLDPAYLATLRKLKSALDPRAILSPRKFD